MASPRLAKISMKRAIGSDHEIARQCKSKSDANGDAVDGRVVGFGKALSRPMMRPTTRIS